MPSGVVYSGSSREMASEQAEDLKWPPATVTRLGSISRAFATFSCSPFSLLPPPARNRAEGAVPLSESTRWAISLARSWAAGSRAASSCSLVQDCSWPRISVKDILRDSQLEVRVELGRTKLTLKDIYDLNVGDVIDLGHPAREPVDLYIGEQPWFSGKLGTQGGSMAVKIIGTYHVQTREEK